MKDIIPLIFKCIGARVGDLVSCLRTQDDLVLGRCKALGKELAQAAL